MAAVLTEEIAANLEEAAQATRRIDTRAVGFFTGGIGVGVVLGFFFGYRYNREKIKAEAFAESEKEVEKIRQIYQQKTVAAQPKPSVEDVVEEKGYSIVVEPERFLKPPVVVAPPPQVKYDGGKTSKSNMEGWDYDLEIRERTSQEPYVIHQDERGEQKSYGSVVYTYWAIDDVLTDEDNRPLPHAQEIVGINNLKFGHGTDDADVVFVRNDVLELEMEICRLHQSYEEEVLGIMREQELESEEEKELEHSDLIYPRNKRRKRRRRH